MQCLRVCGIEAQALAKRRLGLGRLPQGAQRISEVEVQNGAPRVNGNRSPVALRCVHEFFLGFQHHSQIVPGELVGRRQLCGLLQAPGCVLGIAHLEADNPKLLQCARIARFLAQDLLQQRCCLFKAPSGDGVGNRCGERSNIRK